MGEQDFTLHPNTCAERLKILHAVLRLLLATSLAVSVHAVLHLCLYMNV